MCCIILIVNANANDSHVDYHIPNGIGELNSRQPINASTGKEGYEVTAKLEQELTDDGKKVGIFRWGKAWNKSALYDDQAGLHFLFYDPPGPAGLQHDLIGLAGNWARASAAGARD